MILIKDFRSKVPKSSPSYPTLILKFDLSKLSNRHFFSDMRHHNREDPSWHQGTKATKTRKLDSGLAVFLEKGIDKKEEMGVPIFDQW